MDVYFFKKKPTKTAKTIPNTIHCRVTYQKKLILFSTGIKLTAGQVLNLKKQTIIRGNNQNDTINANNALDDVKTNVNNIYQEEFKRLSESPSYEKMKELVQKKYAKKKKKKDIISDILTKSIKYADPDKMEQAAELLGLTTEQIERLVTQHKNVSNNDPNGYISLIQELEDYWQQCKNKTLPRDEDNGKPLSDATLEDYKEGLKVILGFLKQHGDYNINELDMYSVENDRKERAIVKKKGLQIFKSFLDYLKMQIKEVKTFAKPLTYNQKQNIANRERKISLAKSEDDKNVQKEKLEILLEKLEFTGVVMKDKYSLRTCNSSVKILKLFIKRINEKLCVQICTDIAKQVKPLKKIQVISLVQQADLKNEEYIYSLIDEKSKKERQREILRNMYLIVKLGLETTFRLSDLDSFNKDDVIVTVNSKTENKYRVFKRSQKRGIQADFPISEDVYKLILMKDKLNINKKSIQNHLKKFFRLIPSFHVMLKWEEYDNKLNIVKREEPAWSVFSTHTLRKTAITNMREAGLSDKHIAKKSTHSPKANTINESYATTHDELVEEKYEQANEYIENKIRDVS
tara:strand:+ start:966 stop:2690 length:1725 start_codon:yes stop_codon:yes gene_type:complete